MTQLALPSRRHTTPDESFTLSQPENADSIRQRKVGLFMGHLHRANRMREWMRNNLAPRADAYTPRHAGEPQDETKMPVLSESPKHSAGKHIAEVVPLEAVSQSMTDTEELITAGRHRAEVPQDFIQPTPGKHRA